MYASRSYLRKRGTPQQLTDLNECRLVGYVEDLIFTAELEYNKQIFSNWKSDIEISGVIGQFEAVREGAGIGVLHDFMAGNDRSLIPVLPDDSMLSRSYWIVWRESLKNSRRVQGIVDFLTQVVKASADRF